MIDRQAESEKPSAFAMPKKEEQSPAEPPAPALAISDEEIERILRNGSGHHDSTVGKSHRRTGKKLEQQHRDTNFQNFAQELG